MALKKIKTEHSGSSGQRDASRKTVKTSAKRIRRTEAKRIESDAKLNSGDVEN